MGKKAGAWMLALLSVLLISLGFTPYSQTSNYLLISLRLALVALLSILIVRERWKYRHDPQGTNVNPDTGDTILRRFRRWYYDEKT